MAVLGKEGETAIHVMSDPSGVRGVMVEEFDCCAWGQPQSHSGGLVVVVVCGQINSLILLLVRMVNKVAIIGDW